jgi:hypothetical protein
VRRTSGVLALVLSQSVAREMMEWPCVSRERERERERERNGRIEYENP